MFYHLYLRQHLLFSFTHVLEEPPNYLTISHVHSKWKILSVSFCQKEHRLLYILFILDKKDFVTRVLLLILSWKSLTLISFIYFRLELPFFWLNICYMDKICVLSILYLVFFNFYCTYLLLEMVLHFNGNKSAYCNLMKCNTWAQWIS